MQTRLGELDRRLLHALQVEPRVSWTQLSPVLGVDASTLARHWSRLQDEGIAWVSGTDMSQQLVLLEIECELSRLEAVAEQLQSHPRVIVLDVTTGGRDLMALVLAPDLADIADFTFRDVGTIDGVRTARTHLASETLIEGGSWRLRALTQAEVGRIPGPRASRAAATWQPDPEVRAAIVREVHADGRVSIRDMADRSGFSPKRISDALAQLRQQKVLRFRTDIARGVTDWPVYAWYFIDAPSTAVQAARGTITSVPEVRLAFTSASQHNLILAVWLRNLADVSRFEVALQKALEGSRIADRAVVLRTARHMNRLLGTDTLAIGTA